MEPALETAPAESVYERRTRPYIVLMDEDGAIGFAEGKALKLLSADWERTKAPPQRLPFPVELEVQRVLASLKAAEKTDGIITRFPGLAMRVSRLDGAAGSCVALMIERQMRREDLRGAAMRFGFSVREVEVLSLILDGACAGEIAAKLCIAETTVNDHCKSLLRKSAAKNRSDMLAKIFGWRAPMNR